MVINWGRIIKYLSFCRNYSGKPREDVRDLADVTAKSIQPRFEEIYEEVCAHFYAAQSLLDF